MSKLLEVRMNLTYSKVDKKLIPIREFVLIVEKPTYELNNELKIVRGRKCEELRFEICSNESLDSFIDVLQKYKNAKPQDLK